MIPKSRTVLVTGSSRGLGKSIAEQLARDGFDVVVHCLGHRAAADAVSRSIVAQGRASRVLQFDVGDRAAVRGALEQDIKEHGAYYGVVCNAGIHRDGPFPGLTEEDWDQVIRSNLDAFYNVLQPVIMPMVRAKAGGRIVTMSSLSGVAGNRGQVNYSAAKAGIIGATKALAIELAKREITVNCVAPGIIESDMTAELPPEVLQMVPMTRMGRPEEVAAVVSFLMSDAASYVTRQVISVNGGMF